MITLNSLVIVIVVLVALLGALSWKAYQYRVRAQLKDIALHELSLRRSIEMSIENFDERNAEARAAIQGATVFIGDSNVWRWKLEAHFPNEATINRGIGGHQTADVLRRLNNDALQLNARTLIILVGANDFLFTANCKEAAERAESNLNKLVEVATQAGVRTFLGSVLPQGVAGKPLQPDCRESIAALNKRLQERLGNSYLDFYGTLASADGTFKREYSEDGIHPNERGFDVMSRATELIMR